ncbi:2Fe-2S iron-sulfur cluster-binding protein [Massilia sp. B-10]|nr:2Fe-2S iron-sulfur cluster-binding protein [Massilia sp. B-10]
MTRYQIRLMPMDRTIAVDAAGSVLAGAEAVGVVLPSSCRNGTCRTCICLLERGQVRYLVAWPGLSSDEKKKAGFCPAWRWRSRTCSCRSPPRVTATPDA